MRWWRRTRGKDSVEPRTADENVLVISDIHLGEDIVSTGPAHLEFYIRVLNRELAGFIAAHRQRHVGERRWHLVINGDMFDFVKVSLRPEELAVDAVAQPRTESRKPVVKRRQASSVLPNTPENVVWKLKHILDVHRPLFKELAAFLADGHRITIVEGNHDAEFYFPQVQVCLRDHLVRLAELEHGRTKRDGPFLAEAIAGRLCFRSWFEAQAGRYHIEHGHQYDTLCSFEYKLAPDETNDSRTLATPMSHKPIPYVTEVLGDFSTHGVSRWKMLDFVRLAKAIGPTLGFALFRVYWRMAGQMLGRAGGKRRLALRASEARHQAALRALSYDSAYGLETLERLDKLKADPAEYSLFTMLHAFYLDRVFVGGATMLAVFAAGVGGLGQRAITYAALTGGSLLFGLSRVRRVDVTHALRHSAAAIAHESGARYVVFGHSHAPEVINLRQEYGVGRFGESAWYLNSGSWVTREILRGDAGSGMTYVEITSAGASLRRWRGPDQEPVLIANTDDTTAAAGVAVADGAV